MSAGLLSRRRRQLAMVDIIAQTSFICQRTGSVINMKSSMASAFVCAKCSSNHNTYLVCRNVYIHTYIRAERHLCTYALNDDPNAIDRHVIARRTCFDSRDLLPENDLFDNLIVVNTSAVLRVCV